MPRLRWLLIALAGRSSCRRRLAGRRGLGPGEMPDVCSPAVSPAVVTLEPARRRGRADGDRRVRPRSRWSTSGASVRAAGAGDPARADGPVHERGHRDAQRPRLTPGIDFNESMAPGQPRSTSRRQAGRAPARLRRPQPHAGLPGRRRRRPGSRSAARRGGSGSTACPTAATSQRLARDGRAAPTGEVEVEGGEPVDLGTLAVTAAAGRRGRPPTAAGPALGAR